MADRGNRPDTLVALDNVAGAVVGTEAGPQPTTLSLRGRALARYLYWSARLAIRVKH